MRQRALVAGVTAAALVVAILLSLSVGARPIDLGTVWDSIFNFNPDDPEQLIVRDLRWSRTTIGILAGAALAVGGALMQSLTRNPFADPGLLGINAGAATAVVFGITFAGVTGFTGQVWLAFIGAAIAAITVYAIGATGAAAGAPVRLALAGVALTALLTSVTYAVLIVNQSTLNEYRFWVVGSLNGRQGHDMTALWVIVGAALVVGFIAAKSLEAISMGEETAQALGVRIGLTRFIIIAVVTLLAGAATAAAGPIVFVGLAVPHIVRTFVGASLPWLLGVSALGGGVLLLVCDVIGRVIARPSEVAVGITTALIGGAIFAVMARRMKVVEL
ncbi:FecCD family ABC transporter permease [Demequina sediminicola]|uniref:FecCD family ABC transporter permease n=1 Tax=Demequina sediminicola TaxID=1095026 RepID=UPI0007832A7E|nr:iron ABC transporter permease [Demequina sediminicola]